MIALGPLIDQVIYPDTREQALQKNRDDESLSVLLRIVRLEHLITRDPDGWNSVHDWSDVLSGGEKQRLAMARLFYHSPKFAILDECTSAISIDVEGELYEYARKHNITLLTVSHRPSLFPYHEYVLSLDGSGGYEFYKKPINK